MGTVTQGNVAIQGPLGGSAVADTGQYLTFVLASEVYAIGILHIKEIIEFGELTTVPRMPVFIRGVINLRGRVVPVIDLAARFGRAGTAVSRRTSIVIVETVSASGEDGHEETQDIGIMVDAVNEVVDIPRDDLEPPPAFGAGIRSDFIRGMARQGSRFTIVLDVNRVLSVDEMSSIGHVAADDVSQAVARERS